MRRMVIGLMAAASAGAHDDFGSGRAGRRRLQAGAELADAAGRACSSAEEGAAAAGRARSAGRGAPRTRRRQAGWRRWRRPGPTNQPGISGLAIDQQDRIYVFNRGAKPVMVFDTDGKLVLAGADQEINGKKINPYWQHSGARRLGRQRLHHRARRASHRQAQPEDRQVPAAARHDDARRATTPTHFDLPSGIAVLKNGNIIVTDGYGNNRVVLFDKTGKFIKQVGEGRRRSGRQGHRHRRMGAAAQARRRCAGEPLHHRPREAIALQVFDKNLNYMREIKNEWNPWDIAISRKGNDGFGFIADHALERVHKFSLKDGKLLATWGKQGSGPGEFDWVHGIVVDSKGAVYAADTYGQRLQKFVPSGTSF